jgi:hypothetical protein
MAEDQQQAVAQAQAAHPNVMNVNELKTLFSNPKADIPFFMGTTQRTQSLKNLSSIRSKLHKQHIIGQMQ